MLKSKNYCTLYKNKTFENFVKKFVGSGIVKICDELDLRLCNTNGTVVHQALPLQGVQIVQSNLSKNEKKNQISL